MPINLKKELRNLDELPEWKQRLIKAEREKEERLAQEQDEKDFAHNRGIYHPDAIALAKAQAEKGKNDANIKAADALFLDSIIAAENTKFQKQVGAADAMFMDSIIAAENTKNKPILQAAAAQDAMFLDSIVAAEGPEAIKEFWKSSQFKELVNQIPGTAGSAQQINALITRAKAGNAPRGFVPTAPKEMAPIIPGNTAMFGTPHTVTPLNARNTNLPLSLTAGDPNNANSGSLWDNILSDFKDRLNRENTSNVFNYSLPVQRPSYLFDLEGNPFYTKDTNLYEVMKLQYKDSPSYLMREVVPYVVGKTLGGFSEWLYTGLGEKGLTWGGSSEEEFIYQENPTPVQAIAQLLFNVGMLAGEVLRPIGDAITNPHSWDMPGESLQRVISGEQPDEDRTLYKKENFISAWNSVKDSWETLVESTETTKPIPRATPGPGYVPGAYEEWAQQQVIDRQNAEAKSKVLAFNAYDSYMQAMRADSQSQRDILFANSLELQKQSIEERRKSDPMDPWGAATWSREPERYDKFLENAAFLELQLGRPLSVAEVRRLKDTYSNMYTELSFQLVFDVTNLLPVIGQMGQSVQAIPLVNKMMKPIMKTMEVAGESISALPVVKWITKKSVGTVASKITANIHDVLLRMSDAYKTTPELVEGMRNFESTIKLMKVAKSADEAEAIFNEARKLTPGLNALSVNDMKRIMDADTRSITTTWSELMSESILRVEDNIRTQLINRNKLNARRGLELLSDDEIERAVQRYISDPKNAGEVILAFSSRFGESFVNSHRIFDESPLLDDTITGNIAKWASLYASGAPTKRKINPNVVRTIESAIAEGGLRGRIAKMLSEGKLKGNLAKIADALMNWETVDQLMFRLGVGANMEFKGRIVNLVDTIEWMVVTGRFIRDIWSMVVLTTPRWVASNLMDSMGRSIIYGGSLWDDIATLAFSSHRHFMDETGIIPMAMGSNLARGNLGFMETVPARLLYGEAGSKPGINVFRYWKQEYDRLSDMRKLQIANPSTRGIDEAVAAKMVSRLQGKMGKWYGNIWNGFATGMASIPGAVADLNTAIEFTLRTRMFHRKYFQMLETLEPAFKSVGLDILNPAVREIAEQIWQESGGSPSKIIAMVNSIVGAEEGAPKLSMLTPKGWMRDPKTGKMLMDASDAQLFTYRVLEDELPSFIENTIKATGSEPTPEAFSKFIDDMIGGIQESVQSRIAQSPSMKGLDGTINPGKTPGEPPTLETLKGAKPTFDNSRQSVLDAMESMRRKPFKRFDPMNITKSYSDAMSGLALVKEVDGASDISVKMVNGVVEMEIGTGIWSLPQNQMYEALNDATNRYIATITSDSVRAYGVDADRVIEGFVKQFQYDPAAVHNANPDVFYVISEELDRSPRLREIQRLTSSKPVVPYESVKRMYHDSLVSTNSYKYFFDDFDRGDIAARLRQMADDVNTPIYERRHWGIQQANAAVKLNEYAKSTGNADLIMSVTALNDVRERTRRMFSEFGRLVWPGPGRVRESMDRHAAWEAWELLMADAYRVEADMSREILKLTSKNTDEGLRVLKATLENYNEEYLRRVGFNIVWTDDTKTQILRITKTGQGKAQTYHPGSYLVDYMKEVFFPGTKTGTASVVDIAANPKVHFRKKVAYALTDTFGISGEQGMAWMRMMENHATKWSEVTGKNVDDYFERFKFKYEKNAPAAYVQKADDGTFTFYAAAKKDLPSLVKASASVFLDDLAEMAMYNSEYGKALNAINDYMSKGYKPATKLPDLYEIPLKSMSDEAFDSFKRTAKWIRSEVFGGDAGKKAAGGKSFGSTNSPIYKEFYEEGLRKPDIDKAIDRILSGNETGPSAQQVKKAIMGILKYGDEATGTPPDMAFLARMGANQDELMSALDDYNTITRQELTLEEALRQSGFDTSGTMRIDYTMSYVDEAGNVVSAEEARAEKFSRMFMEHLGTAQASNMKSVFNKFQNWLAEEFKILRNMPDAEELSPEVYKAMSSMYAQNILEGEDLKVRLLDKLADSLGVASKDGVLIEANAAQIVDDVAPLPQSMEELLEVSKPAFKRALELGKTKEANKMNSIWIFLEDMANKEMKGEITESEKWLVAFAKLEYLDEVNNIMQVMDDSNNPSKFLSRMASGMNLMPDRKKNTSIHNISRNILYARGHTADEVSKMTRQELLELTMKYMNEAELDSPYRKVLRSINEMIQNSKNSRRTAQQFTLEEIEAAALKVSGSKAPLSMTNEMSEAWNVWKQRRDLSGFPEAAMNSPEEFKTYLRYKIDYETPETAEVYERILYDVENLETRVLRLEPAIPHVPEFQMDTGMRMMLRQNLQVVNNYEEMIRNLELLRTHLTSGKYKMPVLSKESAASLLAWAEKARASKADLVNILLNGGEVDGRKIKGAIEHVNNVMLDYTDQSRLDVFMKNFFPFWMFPSRSVPFWIKTLATHPEIIAFYNKMQRLSNAARLQAGAVTSRGKPIDKLDGYIPLPGTDMWINPLAPLSFKYVLGIGDMVDDFEYKLQSSSEADDEDPFTWSTRQMLEMGPVFGFNLAPWWAWALKGTGTVSENALPQFPLVPEIPLAPRWWINDMLSKMNLMNNTTAIGVMNAIYPESSFQSALVEQQIYKDILSKMQEPGANKAALVESAREAVMEREGNPMWDEAYKNLTNDQAFASRVSFFTGFYPKEFSDAQADLYKLRNEMNILKSALNNEMQASIFKLDIDAEARWNHYLEQKNIPEHQLYRLYVMSGWVRDEKNNLVTDPQERAQYLKTAIIEEQKQMSYFAGAEQIRKELDAELAGLPIGATFEMVSAAYDNYYDSIEKLENKLNYVYTPTSAFGTYKPMSLIEKDLKDRYFYLLVSTRPRFDESVDYETYQARLREWEERLPSLAPLLMMKFRNGEGVRDILDNLHDDQKFDINFWNLLIKDSTLEGVKTWQRDKDDVFDALNEAWSEIYWRPYWDSVGSLKGYDRELAEYDFVKNRQPPTEEELYAWIRKNYGDRFTFEEISKWVKGTDVIDIEQRLLQQRTEEENLRSQIWDLVSWLGPSKDTEMVQYLDKWLEDNAGLKDATMSDLMKHNENLYKDNPEELQRVLRGLQSAYSQLNVQPPTRAQLVQYKMAQDSHEQFKSLINQKYSEIGDSVAEPYEVIMYWQDKWYDVENSKTYSRKFKIENPEAYQLLQQYWKEKKAYGRVDPVWNMYYNMSQDKSNVPEQFVGIFDQEPGTGKTLQYEGTVPESFTPPPTGGGQSGKRSALRPTRMREDSQAEGISASNPTYTPKYTTKTNVGRFTSPNTQTDNTYLPEAMKRSMGSMLVREVNKMLYDGKKLSAPAIKFLESLGERHPEWAEYVGNILLENNTP